ncbi:thiosulfate sulfurtransferase [Magnetococcus marinus MC-1]|uniref:Thiosulfate sulfurtransferase n=1 Tax=Magnetococcus marinus (strain ATCC BAA-1437 / JCM 17883 / MC-1) TaxID=156889 RepID=A0LCK6_MAGMM|nr:rhodanese-like domain-containing protein [Magnetococcus marinus]ABK45699.1 thiosulfate sulfurtransferase [Magnetococcus marinus MC-1]
MLPASPHSPSNPDLHHLTAVEAYAVVQDEQVMFIDIRTEMEHYYVGHPIGVYNVPWQDYPDFAINPDFLSEVEELAQRNQHIVLICRSGHRSIDAGNFLIQHGFQRVSHVTEGFEGDKNEKHQRGLINGWRQRGLPWMQC